MNFYLSLEEIMEYRKIGDKIIREILGGEFFVFIYTLDRPKKICVSVQRLNMSKKNFFYNKVYKEETNVSEMSNNPEQFFREIALRVALGA